MLRSLPMAQDRKLPKGIKRITVIRADGGAAEAEPATVYHSTDEPKKQSRRLRGLEKWARRNAAASRIFGQVYADRHDRSNHKRRNGWLRDLARNLMKANEKARKKLLGW
jgi:Family of unknown function (DUF6312)